MNRKLLVISTMISGVLYLSPAQAHNTAYGSGPHGVVSGSVSIWSGASYGPGYSGTINYGRGYAPAPPYHGAVFYQTCGHWHPRTYRAPKSHAYDKGYVHGYNDGHYGSKKKHKGKHKSHKKSKYKHDRGHGHHH